MTTTVTLVLAALLTSLIVYRSKRKRAGTEAKVGLGRLPLAPRPNVATQTSTPPPLRPVASPPEPAKAPEPARPSSAATRWSRRSDRVLINIPLQVSGTDAEGNSFLERTHTISINRNGGSFYLPVNVQPKDKVSIKNLQTGQLCHFRVRPASKLSSGGLREWGAECVDPTPGFWRISFPDAPETPAVEEEAVAALLECTSCYYREMVRVSLPEYRAAVQKGSLERNCIWCAASTAWKFAVIEVEVEPQSASGMQEWEAAVSMASGVEFRREDRRIVQVPISIRHIDGREEETTTEDVSRSGVCCAADMDLGVGDRVFVKVTSPEGTSETQFRAQIMWRQERAEMPKHLYGMKLGPATVALNKGA